MKKIPTDGSSKKPAINDAFAALSSEGLPSCDDAAAATVSPKNGAATEPERRKKLGKVTLAIEKSGRSGKTVTVLGGSGIAGMVAERRRDLLAELKRKFACGGTVVGDTIELQGDVRARVKTFLQSLGFFA